MLRLADGDGDFLLDIFPFSPEANADRGSGDFDLAFLGLDPDLEELLEDPERECDDERLLRRWSGLLRIGLRLRGGDLRIGLLRRTGLLDFFLGLRDLLRGDLDLRLGLGDGDLDRGGLRISFSFFASLFLATLLSVLLLSTFSEAFNSSKAASNFGFIESE